MFLICRLVWEDDGSHPKGQKLSWRGQAGQKASILIVQIDTETFVSHGPQSICLHPVVQWQPCSLLLGGFPTKRAQPKINQNTAPLFPGIATAWG